MTGKYDIVCFGEVLWDILPSGPLPGGAPVNVAYHLRKLSLEPAVITRVGDDEDGRKLKMVYDKHGLSTDFFQVDRQHHTGKVFANPGPNNEVTYEIVKPVAWDFIEFEGRHSALLKAAECFVFGSLAARSDPSKNTLLRLLKNTRMKVFDINLRPPHFTKELIEELLHHCDLLKMNGAELELIGSWYSDENTVEEKIRSIAKKFDISTIVITLGAEGAVLFFKNKFYQHPGFKVAVRDTIGSGDAFLAALLYGMMENTPPGESLQFANKLGAFIATQDGACPAYEAAQLQFQLG